jgi:LacI family transcriptional regulator
MASKSRPTALFSLNHRTSVYLLQALVEQEIKIPDDMAIIGFDDFDLAGVFTPPLSTVAQSPVEMARRATALLFEGIRGAMSGVQPASAKLVLPTKLKIRASCGSHAPAKT